MKKSGFTLIELSIVLVIIGLLVGGVLVGRDLITAAEVRAQITQIEKYNSAVNTFRGKYNAIPGDMRPEIASQFGFVVGSGCNGTSAARDGNGLIDGYFVQAADYHVAQGVYETGLFWQDMGISGFISSPFSSSNAPIACNSNSVYAVSGTSLINLFPEARIGHANYVYVYENNGQNWFGVAGVTAVTAAGTMLSNATIPVNEAYKMDAKVDDGLPTTGSVVATYYSNNIAIWTIINAPNTTTSGGNATSCFDTTTSTYSITINNGNGGNCAVSFKMQ